MKVVNARVKGIVTRSTGVPFYGIKPYPLLVIGACASSGSVALLLTVYTKFQSVGDGLYSVDYDSKYGFNPLDVHITDEIKKWLDDKGYVLSELPSSVYTNHQKGLHTSDDGVVRRYKEEEIMTIVESECPAFKRHWNPDTRECQACKNHFPDEHSACEEACKKNIKKRAESNDEPAGPNVDLTPSSTSVVTGGAEQKPSKDLAPVTSPDSDRSTSSFKGFREGSRAQVLLAYLQSVNTVSVAVAAQHVAQTCDISTAKALENVRGYISEWKHGKWSGKDAGFPFTITADKDTIRYKENP